MGKKEMKKTTEETIKQWLKAPYDLETRNEVKELISKDRDDAIEAFSGHIEFGTGGMREKMGVGPARINKYTISQVTQGLANYILKHPKEMWKKGVVVCHDCRNHSREFALQTAYVLAGNGITVHITKDLRPTPFCSFAIRHLGAISGVNITASHNPKEYNGYKVYWSDGGQVVSPHDKKIIEEIESVTDVTKIPLSAENSPLIHIIDRSVEMAYLETLYDESLFKHDNEVYGKKLKICYSPLHGAGITMIPDALKLWGFENIELVKNQQEPDGDFPTTKTPNPETKEARASGIETLKRTDGDLLLISDPDSDRLSVSMHKDKKIYTFTGNELGILFLYFLATHKEGLHNWACITTIVSTPLCNAITTDLGGTCFETLTGFKYIAELIERWKEGPYQFLFGFEESLGYLSSTQIRDKDAVLASCQIAEIALHLHLENKTLLDLLYDIYKKYGIYREGGTSIEYKEKGMLDGQMSLMIAHPPETLLGKKVIKIDNYETLISTTFPEKKVKPICLPRSKVLTFYLEDGSRFIFRPSGTEPKIKIYASFHTPYSNLAPIEKQIEGLDKAIEMDLNLLKREFYLK